jgi:hypothetical protein
MGCKQKYLPARNRTSQDAVQRYPARIKGADIIFKKDGKDELPHKKCYPKPD